MPSHTRVHRAPESKRHEEGHDRQERASSPFTLMKQGIDEMDRWFHRVAPAAWSQVAQRVTGEWSPAIEAFQRGDEFVVRAEVPGMSRTDLEVEAGDDTLTIRGERKQEQRGEQDGTFWTERSYGSFSRVIPLPPGTITDSAKATFNNGVLEIVMPAAPQGARRGRRIDISGQA